MKKFYCIIILFLVSCNNLSAQETLRATDFTLISRPNIQREQFTLLAPIRAQTPEQRDDSGWWYDGNTRTWHRHSAVQQTQVQYQYEFTPQPMFMTMPAQQNFGSFCSGSS